MTLISSCLRRLLILALCFSDTTQGRAQQKPPSPQQLVKLSRQPMAKITAKVADESGRPIVEAEAFINFLVGQEDGWGTRDLTHNGPTDDHGTFSASDQCGGAVTLAAIKQGYYKTVTDYYIFKAKRGDQWEPWNPTVKMMLKPILKPIPMYARKVQRLRMPAVGQAMGFDLELGDWITPYGNGTVPDLVFTLRKKFVDVESPFEASLGITFSNEGDGIQPTIAAPHVGSELRLPRHAPETGYQSELVKRTSRAAANQMIIPANKKDFNYFFRVRTRKKDGKIVSTNYGKFDRDIKFDIINSETALLFFTYYLNPTPNDRNMEFDPKRNLFTDLPDQEKVTAP